MPDVTPRWGFTKPLPTETYDINVQNANWDKADQASGVTFATSTTRPASPKDGQQIYETDTGLMYFWHESTSTWLQVQPPPILKTARRWNTAQTLATVTTVETVCMSTETVVWKAGMTYRVSGRIEFDGTAVGDQPRFRLRQSNEAGTLLAEAVPPAGVKTASTRAHEMISGLIAIGATDSTFNLVATVQRLSGTGSIRVYGSASRPYLVAEILGPNNIMTDL